MFTQRTRVWHRSGSDQSRFLLTRQTHADTGIIPPSERLRLFGRRSKKRCECEGSGRPPPPRRLRAFEDASCSPGHINFYVWWQKPSKDLRVFPASVLQGKRRHHAPMFSVSRFMRRGRSTGVSVEAISDLGERLESRCRAIKKAAEAARLLSMKSKDMSTGVTLSAGGSST